MIKKILLAIVAMSSPFAMTEAKTLRVNNVPGSGAQYSNFDDAQSAASEGDVIIFDGSNTNYGNITVSKKLTIQGPGYFLSENDVTSEGIEYAEFESITVTAEGAKISGVVVDNWGGGIDLRANNVVVTNCYTCYITVCENFSYTDESISNCIISQNYIFGGIRGDSYSAPANYMQVSNNVMKGINSFANLNKSTISRNTIIFSDVSYRQITDCIFEYNIGPILGDYWANKDNTVRENIECSNEPYKGTKDDKAIKEVDASLMPTEGVFTHGAFSGTNPYVLSGLPSGPRIQDIEMPESVVQGENMKVTVKIAVTQ